MILLIDILLVVLIISAFSLCIFAIVYLGKISKQIEAIRKDIHQLVENTIPILNNLEEITLHTNKIVNKAEVFWKEIEHSIRYLREKISNFGFLEKINGAQTKAFYLISNFRSVARGISAFWKKYKQR